jgi:hypothetical protein
MGQIAHVDGDPSNSAEDNLAYMCLPHHSLFDSRTSQHKNYTLQEVKAGRNRLYEAIARGEHAENATPQILTRSNVRYPGGLTDVSVVPPGDQYPSRPHTASSAGAWYTSLVNGSELTLESGLAGTAKSGAEYTQESFSGVSTVILGAPTEAAMAIVTKTEATWGVPVPEHHLKDFRRGFVVIACLRFFGGLHSPHYNARATILLNRKPVDWVDLRLKPEHHTDYFHRIPIPDFPKTLALSNCRTQYAWPILRERLADAPNQTVGVSLDNHCWWDIDYVGLVIETSASVATSDLFQQARRPRVFLCHGSEDKNAMRALHGRLLGDGQNPWLDEKDIIPGEDWGEAIQKAIRTSRFVLVCLSRKSVGKTGYVQKEITLALDRADEQPQGRIYMIPVRLEPCDVPQRLRKWQYVDLFEERGYQRLLEALNRSISEEGRPED